MKIQEHIEELQAIQKKHGNVNVHANLESRDSGQDPVPVYGVDACYAVGNSDEIVVRIYVNDSD